MRTERSYSGHSRTLSQSQRLSLSLSLRLTLNLILIGLKAVKATAAKPAVKKEAPKPAAKPAAAAAPAAPAATGDVAALEEACATQGKVVADMKTAGADKDAITAEVIPV